MGALGGRAASVVFGRGEITTNAATFNKVASMARQMVTRFGMSNLGPIALEGGNQEVFVGKFNDQVKFQILSPNKLMKA